MSIKTGFTGSSAPATGSVPARADRQTGDESECYCCCSFKSRLIPLVAIAAVALAGAGLLFILARVWKTWQTFTPANAQATVAFMIFGIIPLDALLLAGVGQSGAALVLLLLMIPGRILGRWMYIT